MTSLLGYQIILENQPDFSERLLEEQIIKFQFTLLFWGRGFEGTTRSYKAQTRRACCSCTTVSVGRLGTKKSSGLLREGQSFFCFSLRNKKSAT